MLLFTINFMVTSLHIKLYSLLKSHITLIKNVKPNVWPTQVILNSFFSLNYYALCLACACSKWPWSLWCTNILLHPCRYIHILIALGNDKFFYCVLLLLYSVDDMTHLRCCQRHPWVPPASEWAGRHLHGFCPRRWVAGMRTQSVPTGPGCVTCWLSLGSWGCVASPGPDPQTADGWANRCHLKSHPLWCQTSKAGLFIVYSTFHTQR